MKNLRKYIVAVCTVLFCSGSAISQSTPNFEFVVKAESGLRLVIVGYGKSGKKIFSKSISSREARSGGPVYVVRVAESIIFENGVGRICVSDKSKKWKRQKKDGKFLPDAVCDNSPTDNRGSYLFRG